MGGSKGGWRETATGCYKREPRCSASWEREGFLDVLVMLSGHLNINVFVLVPPPSISLPPARPPILPLLQLGERFIAVISLIMRRNPKAALGTLNRHMVTGQDEDPGDSW